jgi:hypothetical protein
MGVSKIIDDIASKARLKRALIIIGPIASIVKVRPSFCSDLLEYDK